MSEEEEQVFQSITSAVVTLVSTGLDRWARAQPPSSAMLMVHTHLRGAGQGNPSSSTKQPRRGPRARAGNPGLHFILAKKKAPRKTLASWAEDGERGSVASAQSTERQVCGAYSLTLAETTSQASSLEIILDASRFGAQDTELGVAWASCVGETGGGLAGYLPPAHKRELEWRAEESGAPIRKKMKQRWLRMASAPPQV